MLTTYETKLSLIYADKDVSKDEVLFWLDKWVLRKEYSQDDKRKFFSLLIDFLIEKKEYSITQLSVSRYKPKSVIENIQHLIQS